MGHAVAWAEATYGSSAVERAGKRITWTPKGPISRGEDLFGVADLLCLRSDRCPLLVQVTTMKPAGAAGGSGVAPRRRKAEGWLEAVWDYRADFWVIGWVRGKHFRRWEGSPATRGWKETEPFWSPSLSRQYRQAQKASHNTQEVCNDCGDER
jgi:hypothetical protein